MSLPQRFDVSGTKFICIIFYRRLCEKKNRSKISFLYTIDSTLLSFRVVSINFSFANISNVINIFFNVLYMRTFFALEIKCVRVQGSKRNEAAIFYRWMIYFMNISLYKQALLHPIRRDLTLISEKIIARAFENFSVCFFYIRTHLQKGYIGLLLRSQYDLSQKANPTHIRWKLA